MPLQAHRPADERGVYRLPGREADGSTTYIAVSSEGIRIAARTAPAEANHAAVIESLWRLLDEEDGPRLHLIR